nr:proline-rich protein 2-like [Caretta caretta]
MPRRWQGAVLQHHPQQRGGSPRRQPPRRPGSVRRRSPGERSPAALRHQPAAGRPPPAALPRRSPAAQPLPPRAHDPGGRPRRRRCAAKPPPAPGGCRLPRGAQPGCGAEERARVRQPPAQPRGPARRVPRPPLPPLRLPPGESKPPRRLEPEPQRCRGQQRARGEAGRRAPSPRPRQRLANFPGAGGSCASRRCGSQSPPEQQLGVEPRSPDSTCPTSPPSTKAMCGMIQKLKAQL